MMVRTHVTSIPAALLGWLVALGALALLIPLAQALAIAVGPEWPQVSWFIVAIVLAYALGGRVAGRYAGVAPGWHGLVMGTVSLGIVLGVTLLSLAGDPLTAWLAASLPAGVATRLWVPGYGAYAPAAVGLVAIVLSAWLGGATARVPAVTPRDARPLENEPRLDEERRTVVQRRAPVATSVGAKGGEREESTRR